MARTGASSTLLLGGAALALLAGLVIMAVSRRRNSTH
ncbi:MULTISPECIES: LPXTG cell wall anchor domain-containing protein [Arthrobacter]